MSNHVRVMVQVKSSLSLAATSFSPFAAAPSLDNIIGLDSMVELDTSYSPVPVPSTPDDARLLNEGFAFGDAKTPPPPQTYVLRASVVAEKVDEFIAKSKDNPNIVGVFADPVIQPIGVVCPTAPVGTDTDVERLLSLSALKEQGMNGAGVKVVIVDGGINLTYLRSRGKNPGFDAGLSWGPHAGQKPGDMPEGHGTMCAYDVCIAAPECTLIDHALLTSTVIGGSAIDGLLSDAVKSYAALLAYMLRSPEPFAGNTMPRTLVVNNSWGMYHPSSDFPVGNPQNYSDNPAHPFNIIVSNLEAAGADILFAAGNCGPECPLSRCLGVTGRAIYGANSSPRVLCVAGVTVNGDRLGYSSKGPGRLDPNKPDIASFTHFAGSGVGTVDGGTSAATPVLAGVVAAVRRLYPASILPPALLRDFIRQTARPAGPVDEYGAGIVDVRALLQRLADWKANNNVM